MDYEKIGTFILNLRKEKNMTQQELADKLHVTDKAVSKWETGRGMPDIETIKNLGKLFNVTEKELLNGERDYKKKEIDPNHHSIVLDVQNLSKSFGKRKILSNVNLKIYEGDIVGLIGPNGAGKTTLIKTILSLYKADTGTIKICNYSIDNELEKALSKVGSIVENPDLYQNISGWKNLQIVCLTNHIKDTSIINSVVKLVGLEDRIKDNVKSYSLGMKQRLGLAAALIRKPKILILDEPTNGLDPYGIKDLRKILKYLSEKENMSILISSHILAEVENICDRIIIIKEGKLLSNFGIEEIKNKHISLEDEFLRRTKNVEENLYNENN